MNNALCTFRGVALDLDGVVTDTRQLHFEAWKQTFDDYLRKYKDQSLFNDYDYRIYVDGKTRYEGARSFLASRFDFVRDDVIKQIGIDKNDIYNELLKTKGPRLFKDSVQAIRAWRKAGIPVAIVSSSKNARMVLEKANITDLFDACIDGNIGESRGLRGKPEGDYFIEAAKELDVDPLECVMVEDAVSGVVAGKKASFKVVYGMDRTKTAQHAHELKTYGADTVISSLLEIDYKKKYKFSKLNALRDFDKIKSEVGDKDIALFLDFDGTLAPIVDRPEDACMSWAIKKKVLKASRQFKIGILSGRDRDDVKERVGIPGIFYAGSHGYDISGPENYHFEISESERFFHALDQAQEQLEKELNDLDGIIIERKRYALTVHYRQACDADVLISQKLTSKIANQSPDLKLSHGKKIYELRPNMEWGKGKALEKLCELLGVSTKTHTIFYLGDDTTDEDAFDSLKNNGVGVKVGGADAATQAEYWIDFNKVGEFLDRISSTYAEEELSNKSVLITRAYN